MSFVNKIVDCMISQIQLAITNKQRARIGVFTAKQNFSPVCNAFVRRLNRQYNLDIDSLADAEPFLKARGLDIEVWVKPEPFEDCNHLSLAVGGYTAIIYDYEESVYV